jgi:hypothetical protein
MLHQYLEVHLNLIIGVQTEDMEAAAEAAVDLMLETLEAVMALEAAETVVQETLVDLVQTAQTVQAAAEAALENKEQWVQKLETVETELLLLEKLVLLQQLQEFGLCKTYSQIKKQIPGLTRLFF